MSICEIDIFYVCSIKILKLLTSDFSKTFKTKCGCIARFKYKIDIKFVLEMQPMFWRVLIYILTDICANFLKTYSLILSFCFLSFCQMISSNAEDTRVITFWKRRNGREEGISISFRKITSMGSGTAKTANSCVFEIAMTVYYGFWAWNAVYLRINSLARWYGTVEELQGQNVENSVNGKLAKTFKQCVREVWNCCWHLNDCCFTKWQGIDYWRYVPWGISINYLLCLT